MKRAPASSAALAVAVAAAAPCAAANLAAVAVEAHVCWAATDVFEHRRCHPF